MDLNATDALGYGNSNSLSVSGVVNKICNQSETLYRPITLSGGTMTSSGTFTMNGTWDFYGNSIATAAATNNYINGSGALSLRTSTCSFNLGSNSTLSVSVPIIGFNNGTTPMNLQGSGLLLLAGSNAYLGATNISGGTLELGGAGLLSSGTAAANVANYSAAISNSGVLALNTSVNQTFSGVISGLGSLVQNGPGTVVLASTANTYGGATYVNGGGLLLSSGSLLAGGSVSVAGNATFGGIGRAGSATVLPGGTLQAGINGAGSLSLATLGFSGSGGVFLGNLANSYTSGPALSVNGALTTTGAGSIAITVGSLTGTTTGVAYELFAYNSIGGSGSGAFYLAPLPNRTIGQLSNVGNTIDLTLTGGSDYLHWTGAANVYWNTTSGNWMLNSNSAATTYINGNPLVGGDTVSFDNAGGAGTSVLLATTLYPTVATVTGSNNYTFSGPGSIGGLAGLRVQGPGSLTLACSNSYSGGTTLAGGVLNLNAAQAVGSGTLGISGGTLNANYAQSPSLVALSGGLLNLAGSAAVGSGTLSISGGTLADASGSGITLGNNNPQSWSGSFTVSEPNSLNFGAGGVTVSNGPTLTLPGGAVIAGGVISGTGGLTIAGSGTLVIANAGTFSGTATVNGGTLTLQGGNSSPGALQNSPIVVNSNGVLNLSYSDALGYGNTNPLTVYGKVVKSVGQSETLSRPITLSGGTMTSTGLFPSTNGAWNLYGSTITTASGTSSFIAGTGQFSLRTNGSANPAFNLGASSTLTVSVPITSFNNSGTASMNLNGAGLLLLTGSSAYLGATNISSGTLEIGGAGLLSNGTAAANVANYSATIANSGVLAVNTSVAQTFSGVISGSGTLQQMGPGTLTLAASGNTYYGPTVVTGGALAVTGTADINASGRITVSGPTAKLLQLSSVASARDRPQPRHVGRHGHGRNRDRRRPARQLRGRRQRRWRRPDRRQPDVQRRSHNQPAQRLEAECRHAIGLQFRQDDYRQCQPAGVDFRRDHRTDRLLELRRHELRRLRHGHDRRPGHPADGRTDQQCQRPPDRSRHYRKLDLLDGNGPQSSHAVDD